MRSSPVVFAWFLVAACGPSPKAQVEDPSAGGTDTSSGDGSGSTTSQGGDASTGGTVGCSAIEDPDACNAVVGEGGLQACAWVELNVVVATEDSCDGGSRETCIELTQSPAEGCIAWSCLGESDNVFFREIEAGAHEVVSGPFCGNEPAGFASCGTDDRPQACDCRCAGGAPEICEDDPTTEDCRDQFARYCEELGDADTCATAFAFGVDGTEIRCTWITPTRWTIDAAGGPDSCQSSPEPGRCVAGDFMGDGGAGCDPRWDPSDGGTGAVIGSATDCAAPYEWSSCAFGATPPECACVE